MGSRVIAGFSEAGSTSLVIAESMSGAAGEVADPQAGAEPGDDELTFGVGLVHFAQSRQQEGQNIAGPTLGAALRDIDPGVGDRASFSIADRARQRVGRAIKAEGEQQSEPPSGFRFIAKSPSEEPPGIPWAKRLLNSATSDGLGASRNIASTSTWLFSGQLPTQRCHQG